MKTGVASFLTGVEVVLYAYSVLLRYFIILDTLIIIIVYVFRASSAATGIQLCSAWVDAVMAENSIRHLLLVSLQFTEDVRLSGRRCSAFLVGNSDPVGGRDK